MNPADFLDNTNAQIDAASILLPHIAESAELGGDRSRRSGCARHNQRRSSANATHACAAVPTVPLATATLTLKREGPQPSPQSNEPHATTKEGREIFVATVVNSIIRRTGGHGVTLRRAYN
jgi:hypothetical protein